MAAVDQGYKDRLSQLILSMKGDRSLDDLIRQWTLETNVKPPTKTLLSNWINQNISDEISSQSLAKIAAYLKIEGDGAIGQVRDYLEGRASLEGQPIPKSQQISEPPASVEGAIANYQKALADLLAAINSAAASIDIDVSVKAKNFKASDVEHWIETGALKSAGQVAAVIRAEMGLQFDMDAEFEQAIAAFLTHCPPGIPDEQRFAIVEAIRGNVSDIPLNCLYLVIEMLSAFSGRRYKPENFISYYQPNKNAPHEKGHKSTNGATN